MSKDKKREAFNFYRSYFTVLEMMNDTEKLEFLMALFNRQFHGIEPNLTGTSKLVYMSQQHSIDKQVIGWETKQKTKLSTPTEGPSEGPTEGPNEPPYVQEKEEGQEKEKEKEKEQVKEQEQVKEYINILEQLNTGEFDKDEIEITMINHTCSEEEAIEYLMDRKHFTSTRKKELNLNVFEF